MNPADNSPKLAADFFRRPDTLAIARELIGKLLVVPDGNGNRVTGMIVETEAYLGEIDRAAHSFGGRRTARNEITYAAGGHVYVFFIYGMYYQLNFVCGPEDSPHVCLIRAVEPVEGIELMRERRNGTKDLNLTSGPGKLCIAFAIDRTLNGENLSGERIWLEDFRTPSPDQIACGPRIGIDYAGEFVEKPWRFWLKGNDYVSRQKGKRGNGETGKRGNGEKGKRGKGEKGKRGKGETGKRGNGETGKR